MSTWELPCEERDFSFFAVLIHRESEKGSSQKPAYIHPHSYTVPGRTRAGLISGLPRRVLLGNSDGMKRSGAVCNTPALVENALLVPHSPTPSGRSYGQKEGLGPTMDSGPYSWTQRV